MTRIPTILSTFSLTLALAAAAVAPTASAHKDCYEGAACGDCLQGDHGHYYPETHEPYCESSTQEFPDPGPNPPPAGCYVGTRDICILRDPGLDCVGAPLQLKVPDDVRQAVGDVSVGELCP